MAGAAGADLLVRRVRREARPRSRRPSCRRPAPARRAARPPRNSPSRRRPARDRPGKAGRSACRGRGGVRRRGSACPGRGAWRSRTSARRSSSPRTAVCASRSTGRAQRGPNRLGRRHDPAEDRADDRHRDRRAGATSAVEAGVLGKPLAQAAAEHGLCYLAGTSPDAGVVGYTLGGGLSWMIRKYGLAANSVVAVELITADGRHVRATQDDEPDLFWGVRGGGGNFGAVTALELALYPHSEIYAGCLFWPIERATEILDRLARVGRRRAGRVRGRSGGCSSSPTSTSSRITSAAARSSSSSRPSSARRATAPRSCSRSATSSRSSTPSRSRRRAT